MNLMLLMASIWGLTPTNTAQKLLADSFPYFPSTQEKGRIWFPHTSQMNRLPLAMVAHGNGFYSEDYLYLVEVLLREGFAVACVSAPDNQDIQQRATSLVSHLDYLFYKDPQKFNGQVIFVGHSRGGEAVIHAANNLARSTYLIKAVISLAPSQIEPLTALENDATSKFLILYGSHDSDITGHYPESSPMESPFGLYDVTFPNSWQTHHKWMVYIQGGSHIGFSDLQDEDWVPGSGEPSFLETHYQRAFAGSIVEDFVHWTMSEDPILAKKIRHSLLPGFLLNAPLGDAQKLRYTALFQGNLIAPIDDFEDGLPERNHFQGLVYASGSCGLRQDAHFRLDASSPHHGQGMMVWWSDGEPASVTFEIPKQVESLKEATHLVFNVSQRYLDQNNLLGAPQDFRIAITSLSDQHYVQVSDWGQIQYPIQNVDREPPFADFTKSPMTTLQIPLEAFSGWKRGFEVRKVSFLFDVPRADGKITGCLIFDDLGFARFMESNK